MPSYQVAAHCRYYIRYHLVWIVKRREPLLVSDSIRRRLVELLSEIGKMYELPVEEIGVDGDHLHLFCQGLPRLAPAKVVEIFKSISARELRREFPELRKQTYGAGLWGVGYYLSTVGHKTAEEAVRAYVKTQGKKTELGNYKQLSLIT